MATAAHDTLPTDTAITEKIRSILRDCGLSVNQLAALAHVPPTTLARQLRSGDLWVSTLTAICHALDVDPAALLDSATADTVTAARRIAARLDGLDPAERHVALAIIDATLQLRDTAVVVDRRRAGQPTKAGRG